MAEPSRRQLVSTNDGFVVAQKDLELRGAGGSLAQGSTASRRCPR